MSAQGEIYLEITAVQRRLQCGYVTPQIYQKILAIFDASSKVSLVPQLKAYVLFAVDRFDPTSLEELTEQEIIYMVKLLHLLEVYLKPKAQNTLHHWTRMFRQISLPHL